MIYLLFLIPVAFVVFLSLLAAHNQLPDVDPDGMRGATERSLEEEGRD